MLEIQRAVKFDPDLWELEFSNIVARHRANYVITHQQIGVLLKRYESGMASLIAATKLLSGRLDAEKRAIRRLLKCDAVRREIDPTWRDHGTGQSSKAVPEDDSAEAQGDIENTT